MLFQKNERTAMYPIILASNSPRRKEILSQIGLEFTVVPSTMEEDMTMTNPRQLVQELSKQKARDVANNQRGPVLVIGADTIVVSDHQILGKPKSMKEAYCMIEQLQGNFHEVYTGVTVLAKHVDDTILETTFVEVAKVKIAKMTSYEIEDYIATKEPMDKAGAYAIQGKFACYVERIEGDYYTIVGLPIAHLYQVLKEMNVN
jgi:septum formation protein